MIILFVITTLVILIYLFYPLWLQYFIQDRQESEIISGEIKNVSLILLSYNGMQYLDKKIASLQNELAAFDDYELIIIDDKSTDGSTELLKTLSENDHLKILFNMEHRGIPYSMNRGVSIAKYDVLIFSDQRQTLSENSLKRIVEPLRKSCVGAASSCISDFDKNCNCSFIRKHENFLKIQESKSGSLIGVYGPLYAIKKECYIQIPENIILDDLYLSLQILKSNRIVIVRDCEIVDENFFELYNFSRMFRYLKGFIQIIRNRLLFRNLSLRIRTMLLWHKYLRLLIPVLLAANYMILGTLSPGNRVYLVFFVGLTILGVTTLLPSFSRLQIMCRKCLLMIIFNIAAWTGILIHNLSKRKQITHRSSSYNTIIKR